MSETMNADTNQNETDTEPLKIVWDGEARRKFRGRKVQARVADEGPHGEAVARTLDRLKTRVVVETETEAVGLESMLETMARTRYSWTTEGQVRAFRRVLDELREGMAARGWGVADEQDADEDDEDDEAEDEQDADETDLDAILATFDDLDDGQDEPRTDGGTSQDDAADEQDADEPQFETGEQVADATEPADERGTMRVLDADAGRADEVEVGSTGVSVADYDGNEAVDGGERVVTCVFESFLDSHVPEWSITPADELPEFLDAYSAEWGVGIQTYDYPASRLTAAVSDAVDETGEDTQDETDADTGGVVRHMDDLRGDHDVPAPDLPTEAEQDADDDADEPRTDGGLACRGSFDARPSVDGITRHVAEFPAFSMAYEADLAVYELIGEQVERIVDNETARLAGGRL